MPACKNNTTEKDGKHILKFTHLLSSPWHEVDVPYCIIIFFG